MKRFTRVGVLVAVMAVVVGLSSCAMVLQALISPTFKVTYPSDGAYIANTNKLTITGTVEDTKHLKAVMISMNNGTTFTKVASTVDLDCEEERDWSYTVDVTSNTVYNIHAYADGGDAKGATKEITIYLTNLDEVEPNNTYQTANALGIGVPKIGAISSTSDVDYYILTNLSAIAYDIETYDPGFGTDFDNVLTLYDTNGTTFLTNSDDVGVVTSFTYTIPAAGDYYIKVSTGDSRIGTYKIRYNQH